MTLVKRLRDFGGFKNEMEVCNEAADEIERLTMRYETLRRMNPRQFTELYRANVEQGILFDDLVDNAAIRRGG